MAAKRTRKTTRKTTRKGAGTRKKATAKKAPGRKKAARKTATRKTAVRKKTAGKKRGRKKSGRKYSPGASGYVRNEMEEYQAGTARSGRSGRKVKSRRQAIAIGLSEARRSGEEVPPNPKE